MRSRMTSLDNPICPHRNCCRDCDVEMPCDLEVDRQPKACRLFDGQFRSVGSASDLVNVGSRKPSSGLEALTVAQQSFVFGDVAVGKDQWQAVFLRESSHPWPQVPRGRVIRQDKKRIGLRAQNSLCGRIEIAWQVAVDALVPSRISRTIDSSASERAF